MFRGRPDGQPYLVDHYSYRADRNRRERAWNNFGESIELGEQATEFQRRADTAQHHMDAQTAPMAVARRIRVLETELRRLKRDVPDATCGCWTTLQPIRVPPRRS